MKYEILGYDFELDQGLSWGLSFSKLLDEVSRTYGEELRTQFTTSCKDMNDFVKNGEDIINNGLQSIV